MPNRSYDRGHRLGLLAVACAVLWLGGCTGEPAAPIRVGTNLWVGYEPLYLARALNAFRAGSVHLVELPSTTEVLQALRSDTLEAAALTLDEVLAEGQFRSDLRVVLVLDESHGGDALLAGPGIDAPADLRGRRIGFENSGVGALLLDAALRAGGLTPADVQAVPITPDQHVASFRQGAVDAVVAYEPAVSLLRAAGARVIYDSTRLPGRIVDVLVVREEVARRDEERVRELIRGWFKALQFIETTPREAYPIMAERQHVAPWELERALAGLRLSSVQANRDLLLGDAPRLAQVAADLVRVMQHAGQLSRPPELDGLFDGRFLP